MCERSEYVQLLRQEIGDPSRLDYTKLEKLPLLDSFIKETVRVNPLDTRKYPKELCFRRGRTPWLDTLYSCHTEKSFETVHIF